MSRGLWIAPLVVLATTAVVRADDAGVGGYDVKYEETSNSCEHFQTLKDQEVRIAVKQGALTINIDTIPQMVGVPQKNGKIKVTSKVGPSIIQGADAKYSAGGRSTDGMLELVLAAEYSVKGRSLCSQTWQVGGLRKRDGKGKDIKPGKPTKPPKS